MVEENTQQEQKSSGGGLFGFVVNALAVVGAVFTAGASAVGAFAANVGKIGIKAAFQEAVVAGTEAYTTFKAEHGTQNIVTSGLEKSTEKTVETGVKATTEEAFKNTLVENMVKAGVDRDLAKGGVDYMYGVAKNHVKSEFGEKVAESNEDVGKALNVGAKVIDLKPPYAVTKTEEIGAGSLQSAGKEKGNKLSNFIDYVKQNKTQIGLGIFSTLVSGIASGTEQRAMGAIVNGVQNTVSNLVIWGEKQRKFAANTVKEVTPQIGKEAYSKAS